MILTKIWEKKLFLNILKISLFFLFAIFTIVIIIDFSLHSAKIFSHSQSSFLMIVKYYFNLFVIQLNLLLSFTFLLAMIKVLSDMNIHHELTALKMGGISSKLLSRPFLIIAIIFSAISYINYQFFYSDSITFKEKFKGTFLKKQSYSKKELPNVIYLIDNTKLIYQKSNIFNKELYDVYYIKSSSDIWHAKSVLINNDIIVGRYVDHLVRKNDFFEKEKSYVTYNFKDMKLDKNAFLFTPVENRSISTLFTQSQGKSICLKEKNELLANFNYKLAMPLTSIFIVFGVFPYLIRFSRNISFFYICAFSIFGFVIFNTIMDSALILAENFTIQPFIIIWLPVVSTSSICLKKYIKI